MTLASVFLETFHVFPIKHTVSSGTALTTGTSVQNSRLYLMVCEENVQDYIGAYISPIFPSYSWCYDNTCFTLVTILWVLLVDKYIAVNSWTKAFGGSVVEILSLFRLLIIHGVHTRISSWKGQFRLTVYIHPTQNTHASSEAHQGMLDIYYLSKQFQTEDLLLWLIHVLDI